MALLLRLPSTGTVAASKFENFNNVYFPNPAHASDSNDSTGITRFSGSYPNQQSWVNYYIDCANTTPGWTGAAPAAPFVGKTILAVRSTELNNEDLR